VVVTCLTRSGPIVSTRSIPGTLAEPGYPAVNSGMSEASARSAGPGLPIRGHPTHRGTGTLWRPGSSTVATRTPEMDRMDCWQWSPATGVPLRPARMPRLFLRIARTDRAYSRGRDHAQVGAVSIPTRTASGWPMRTAA
jgi:hypothetical protein